MAPTTVVCLQCESEFSNRDQLFEHVRTIHRRKKRLPKIYGLYSEQDNFDDAAPVEHMKSFTKIEAFKGFFKVYRCLLASNNIRTVRDFFALYDREIRLIFASVLKKGKNVKFQITTVCEFMRPKTDTMEEEICTHYINSNMCVLYGFSQYKQMLEECLSDT